MAPLILDNATLWIGDSSSLDGHLVVRDGVIERVDRGQYEGPEVATDLEGLALSPGMIDLMVLGGFGLSFARNDPMEIARQYLALGVTSCQFCTGNQAWDRYVQIGEKIRREQADRSLDAAGVIGVYLEGQFRLRRILPATPATVSSAKPIHAVAGRGTTGSKPEGNNSRRSTLPNASA